jgi:flagellar biosynthesis protein FlhB
MQNEPEQNRTEPATPFKREEARKRGQVAKSLDVNTTLIIVGFIVLLVVAAPGAAQRLGIACSELFALASSDADLAVVIASFARSLAEFLIPIAMAALVLGIVANLVQTGPIFSAHPIKPQFNRLNPVAGFKRVYNKRMLFEAFKAVLKIALLGVVVAAFFVGLWPAFTTLENSGTAFQLAWLGSTTQTLAVRLALVLVAIGLLDLVYSRWQFGKQLMMSRREIKEEVKRREGDPLVRQKIRELQRENLKQSRSLGRVAEADVLITNPEHLAIALKYVRGEMSAPVILAKGADLWAAQMRALAREHGIPIEERKPLARLLFRRGAIDGPIPPESFLEVARVYASLAERAARLRAMVRASAVEVGP